MQAVLLNLCFNLRICMHQIANIHKIIYCIRSQVLKTCGVEALKQYAYSLFIYMYTFEISNKKICLSVEYTFVNIFAYLGELKFDKLLMV